MTPPISPFDLQRVLTSLPPERPDPFPHLLDLSADALLMRRVEVTGQIKTLEQERQAIDAALLEVPLTMIQGVLMPLPNNGAENR